MVYAYFPADPRVRREVESLRGAGHEVDVICLRDDGELSRETVRGVGVVRVPLLARRGGRLRYLFQYVLFFLLSLVQLIRLHRHRAFQAVHVHSLPDFQLFELALFLALLEDLLLARQPDIDAGVGADLALLEGEEDFLGVGEHLRLARLAERLSVRFADQVITVNEAVKGVVAERTGRSDIVVVMNSPDAYALRSGDTAPLRLRLGLDSDPTIAQRVHNCFGSIVDFQLPQNRADVIFNRLIADAQLAADDFVAIAACDIIQDFDFPA